MVRTKVNQGGEFTKKRIKHLGSEYQRLKQKLLVSGIETQTPFLRGSHEVFQAYEEYYSLFNPHGGSVLPTVIMTETSVVE